MEVFKTEVKLDVTDLERLMQVMEEYRESQDRLMEKVEEQGKLIDEMKNSADKLRETMLGEE